MKTDKINTYTPQFGSVYRIKHTAHSDCEFFNNILKPLYSNGLNTYSIYIFGKNPIEPAIFPSLQAIASKMGYSSEWLRTNINIHGRQLPDPNDMVSWVVTGVEDIKHLDKARKNIKLPGTFKFLISVIKDAITGKLPNYNGLPEHLRPIFMNLDAIEKVSIQFEKDMSKNKKVIECDNFGEFISKFTTTL